MVNALCSSVQDKGEADGRLWSLHCLECMTPECLQTKEHCYYKGYYQFLVILEYWKPGRLALKVVALISKEGILAENGHRGEHVQGQAMGS